MIPPEKKSRIVLSILAGEVSIAEAARKEKVSEQSIGRWKAEFIEAGKSALAAGKTGPSTREAQLEAEVDDLTRALGEVLPASAQDVPDPIERIVTPSASHAWFVGMNPQLGDRAPFAVLGDDPDSASRVLAAAKAFVVSG